MKSPNPASEVLPPILIVDDNPDDIFFLRRALTAGGVRHPVITFDNAENAVTYLLSSALGTAPPAGRPSIIFSDIKMPGMDGFTFLKWVRAQSHLDSIKVVMVTTSNVPEDIERAIAGRADGYLEKFPAPAVLAACVQGKPTFPPSSSLLHPSPMRSAPGTSPRQPKTG